MKTYSVLILSIIYYFLFANSANSQCAVGFYGGLNISELRIYSTAAPAHSIEINYNNGYSFGIFTEFFTNKIWDTIYCYFQPEIRYIQKGVKGKVEPYPDWPLNYSYKYDFIEIPLFYKALISFDKFNIHSFWGINLGFTIKARQEVRGFVKPFGTYLEYSDIKDESIASKLDFSLDSGFGIEYKYNEKIGLPLYLRYSFGLVDLYKPDGEERYSTGFQILLGLRLRDIFN